MSGRVLSWALLGLGLGIGPAAPCPAAGPELLPATVTVRSSQPSGKPSAGFAIPGPILERILVASEQRGLDPALTPLLRSAGREFKVHPTCDVRMAKGGGITLHDSRVLATGPSRMAPEGELLYAFALRVLSTSPRANGYDFSIAIDVATATGRFLVEAEIELETTWTGSDCSSRYRARWKGPLACAPGPSEESPTDEPAPTPPAER